MVPSSARRALSQVTSTRKMLGSSTWAASRVACGDATWTPAFSSSRGPGAVAVQEGRLAADAAQHPQPGDRVGAERGQLAGDLALDVLPPLQRAQQRTEQQHHRRYADQHDQAEQHGGAQQQHRDDRVRRDGPREPGGDVEGPAESQRVVGGGGDDLAGGQPPADGDADQGAVPAEELHRPERGRQPVRHRDPVPEDAEHGLHQGQPQDHQRPLGGRGQVTVGDPGLQAAADGGRHQGLRDHPDHAVDHAEQQGAGAAGGRSRAGSAPGRRRPAGRGRRREGGAR